MLGRGRATVRRTRHAIWSGKGPAPLFSARGVGESEVRGRTGGEGFRPVLEKVLAELAFRVHSSMAETRKGLLEPDLPLPRRVFVPQTRRPLSRRRGEGVWYELSLRAVS